ncbi:MAG TPA: hypothetical protein VGQ76_05135 [Thermoanaerobaculia bacterium]|jgi:hypothetical protein|nr:hypothetical protein [Thermoanaerobaculia bacterium]
MCDFVIAACRSTDLPAARALLRSPFHMQPIVNASIAALLPADWETFTLTDGTCSCEMYSDSGAENPRPSIEDRIATFRAKHAKPKFRKQGWSDAKIERAVEQMRQDVTPSWHAEFDGLRIDVRRALAELARMTKSVALLVHPFSGSVDTETIRAQRQNISVAKLIDDESPIATDVLYLISPRFTTS